METKPTNEEVIAQSKKSDEAAASFILEAYSGLISKPSLSHLNRAIQRLKDKHKQLNRRRKDEIKKGIAGQEGTYDHWKQQTFIMPSASEPGESQATASSNSKSITRSEAIDLREELKQSQGLLCPFLSSVCQNFCTIKAKPGLTLSFPFFCVSKFFHN